MLYEVITGGGALFVVQLVVGLLQRVHGGTGLADDVSYNFV